MNKYQLLLIVLAVLLMAIATDAKVTLLDKGQAATYRGFLFDSKSELKARIALKEAISYKAQFNASLELIHTQGMRIANKQETIDNLNARLNSTVSPFVYLFGGMIVGGLLVK